MSSSSWPKGAVSSSVGAVEALFEGAQYEVNGTPEAFAPRCVGLLSLGKADKRGFLDAESGWMAGTDGSQLVSLIDTVSDSGGVPVEAETRGRKSTAVGVGRVLKTFDLQETAVRGVSLVTTVDGVRHFVTCDNSNGEVFAYRIQGGYGDAEDDTPELVDRRKVFSGMHFPQACSAFVARPDDITFVGTEHDEDSAAGGSTAAAAAGGGGGAGAAAAAGSAGDDDDGDSKEETSNAKQAVAIPQGKPLLVVAAGANCEVKVVEFETGHALHEIRSGGGWVWGIGCDPVRLRAFAVSDKHGEEIDLRTGQILRVVSGVKASMYDRCDVSYDDAGNVYLALDKTKLFFVAPGSTRAEQLPVSENFEGFQIDTRRGRILANAKGGMLCTLARGAARTKSARKQ